MDSGKIYTTPTGYGVIKVATRKQVTLPKIDAPIVVKQLPIGPVFPGKSVGGQAFGMPPIR